MSWSTPLIVVALAASLVLAGGASAAPRSFPVALAGPAASAPPSCPAPCDVILATGGDAAPVGGDLIGWKIKTSSAAAVSVTPAVYRLVGGRWLLIASGSATSVDGSPSEVEAAPLRLPIQAGDRIGFRVISGSLPRAFASSQGERTLIEADGTVTTESGAPTIQGVIEPDGDLSITAEGPAFTTVDSETPYAFTVRNAGPSSAPQVTVTDQVPPGTRAVRADAGGGPCVVGATIRCELGTLAGGGARTVSVVLAPTQADVAFAHAVRVAGGGVDIASANDTATIQTFVTMPSIAPPPIVVVSPPCVNVRRGTDDDDLLAGTAFGDRLVGRAGRDLLRGGDGPDCLEGGDGGDVLNGDGGDDRLSGADGRDRLSGGTGDDRIVGGRKADALYGNAGNDQLFPSSGRDRVIAGAGDDVISARDGSRDTIDCGPGRDRVIADRVDRLRGCERAARR